MKYHTSHFVYLLILTAGLFSCGKKTEQINYIPKEATIVASIDLKSIYEKSEGFKYLAANEKFSSLFGNPEQLKNSGIELTEAYGFGEWVEDQGYGAVVFSLADASKFEAYVKATHPDLPVTKQGDIYFASAQGNEQKSIAWKNDAAIFLIQNQSGTSSKEKLTAFFATTKENALYENSGSFKELQNKKGDILGWVNLEKAGKQMAAYSPLGPGIDFKNTFITTICNFEKGKLELNSSYHSNPDSKEKLDLTKGSISNNVSNALPGNTVVAMVGLSLDMGRIYDYLEKGKYVENAEDISKQTTGMSIKEIFQLLSGEVAATLNGVQLKEIGSTDLLSGDKLPQQRSSFQYALAIGIKDKAKSAQLISRLLELKILEKTGNYYTYDQSYFIIDKGDALVITSSEQVKQSILTNTAEKLPKELSGLLTQNAGSLYVNVKSIPEEFFSFTGQEVKSYISASQVEAITITGSPVKENISTSKVVVSFLNKDENSLAALSRISGKTEEAAPPATMSPGVHQESDTLVRAK